MEYSYLSKYKIIETLKEKNAHIRKSLGQNFLVDPNYINKIINFIKESIPKNSKVLEIGPGLGAITHLLIHYYNVEVVEIDAVLCEILKQSYSIKIYNIDILKFIKEHSLKDFNYVVGNLPYYITTDIIINTLNSLQKPSICIFLVQKEYAQKLFEENNSISIYVHNFAKIKKLTLIPKNAFYPIPKVDSMLIQFNLLEKPYCNPKILEKILRMSFRGKRKKIINSWEMGEELINILLLKEKSQILSLDFSKRAEELPKEFFYQLTNLVSSSF